MDNFKAVYRILSALERMMELPEANPELISAKRLGVSWERRISDGTDSVRLMFFIYRKAYARKRQKISIGEI